MDGLSLPFMAPDTRFPAGMTALSKSDKVILTDNILVNRFSIQSIFIYLASRSAFIRYGLALLVVVAASLATLHLPAIGERAVFLLFSFGITQVLFWLGLYPGIFAGVLSLAAANLLVLHPAAIPVDDAVLLNAGFCVVSIVMVITAGFHRQLADELWQSRQDLAHAQAVGQIGSWRLNVARNELIWSDENHRIFGIPKGMPMCYETFLAVVHPDDRDYVDRMWQAGLRGEPYDIEHRLIVAGNVKWVREKAVLEFDGKGNLIGGFGITQDITRRIELQDRLAKVAASVPGLICSFRLLPDGSACMPYASPAVESMYGIGGEVLAEDFSPVFARIHPDDIGRIRASVAESASRRQPWRATFRYNHPLKGEVWLEGHSMPIPEADGGMLWHGYVHDITDRINAETVLKEQIDRYELVLEGAQDAIWDWDVKHRRVHYSSRWKALHGYAEQEIGNGEDAWRNAIHPDDLERIMASVQRHFAGETPVFCEEYRIRCKDGTWKWILDRGLARKDGNGAVVRMAGSERDITEHKLAENALRDHEAQLRLIMDATPALISYLDADFRYLRVNANYEKWFGTPAEQILGRPAEEIIGAEAWRRVSPYLLRARAGETVAFDQQIPYGSGARWVHATYLPNIDADGHVGGIVVHVIDIAERVSSEQKITLLNQRLQRRIQEMQVIFNTVPIGLSIADRADGKHIRGNAALEHMLGLPANSELSMRQHTFAGICVKHNGVELATEALPMERAFRGETVSNQILEIARAGQGQAITVLCNTAPLLDEDGVPRGAVGAFLDITPLRRAERSLANSQRQLQLLVEQAPLSIAMFDTDMNFIVTSRFWLEEFGQGYDDLAGRNHYVVNPDLPLVWKQVHQRVLSGEYLRNTNDLWVHADGSRHWFDWAANPWTDTNGKIGGIIITSEDVTARRQAELALRHSEARLALIVDQVKAGYWDWDFIGRRLFLSPEAKQQIGFDDCDIPTRREEWEARIHPDDLAFVLKFLQDYADGSQSHFEAEFRFRHQDGHYRWIRSRSVLLNDANDRPCRMLGINLDTTEFMEQKQINEQRDKMEQSFRLYVAMQTAAAIAHELNQPLSAISSYADVALHMLQTRSSNRQKLLQLMQKCSAQAQRAGEVIRQLLVLLQKAENPSERVDVNVCVRDAISLFEADAVEFKVETDFAADLPPVMANAMQIQKVLVNLFRNGAEAMQEQGKRAGKIVVKTRRCALDSSMAQVTVQDSGTGVADTALLRTIFQPFYTTKSKSNGLGMGLAISRSLIAAHGGKMWAEPNAGQGLSIHFTLPIAA